VLIGCLLGLILTALRCAPYVEKLERLDYARRDARPAPSCDQSAAMKYATPLSAGPYEADVVICAKSRVGTLAQMVSPNGRSAAGEAEDRRLIVTDYAGTTETHTYPTRIEAFDQSFGRSHVVASAFGWDANSNSVYAVRQEVTERGGWPTTPKQAIRVSNERHLNELPPLIHAAGPLDAIMWIDHGLALAQFGTKGDYYRPKRINPEPTLAIVDALHGKVLDAIPIRSLGGEVEPKQARPPQVGDVSAVRLADGRIRVLLLREEGWLIWTRGQKPSRLPALSLDQRYIKVTLTPDGEHVLVASALPTRTICPRVPPCEVGPVVEGTVAELRELRSGKTLWSISGKDQWGTSVMAPAISPNGRFALVKLPAVVGREPSIALVSMGDGGTLQLFPGYGNSDTGAGFTQEGRMWTSSPNDSRIYRSRKTSFETVTSFLWN